MNIFFKRFLFSPLLIRPKQGLFFFCFLLIVSGSVRAQTTVVLNSGTSGIPDFHAGPLYRSSPTSTYDFSRFSYLYTPDELAAAGLQPGSEITELAWFKMNGDSSNGGAIISIYMNNTDSSDYSVVDTLWNDLISAAELVFTDSSYQIPKDSSPTAIPFSLQQPFVYTGGALEISVDFDISDVSGAASSGSFDWLWNSIPDRILGYAGTSSGNIEVLSSIQHPAANFDDRRPALQLTFNSIPCSVPVTPGAAVNLYNAIVCSGQSLVLDLQGQSTGVGQKYRWQYSNTTTGPFIDLDTFSFNPRKEVFPASNLVYRAAVQCAADTQFSSVVQVSLQSVLPAGTYTIDQSMPTSGSNFSSFEDAIKSLSCGIAGPVFFNVNGSQVFYEQMEIGEINGTSVSNFIRFNGNGAILKATPNSQNKAAVRLNGTDHVIVDSLNIICASSSIGWGIHLMNGANSNVFTNCVIDMTALTSNVSSNGVGIVFTNSKTSIDEPGDANDNVFKKNKILGGLTGLYAGIWVNGNGGAVNCRGNQFVENVISNVYSYNLRLENADSCLISRNYIQRSSKKTVGVFYGIYLGEDCRNNTIERNDIHHTHDSATTLSGTSYGIHFGDADGTVSKPNLVFNNLIHDFNGEGTIYGIYNRGSDYAKYYFNTISLDNTNAVGGNFTRGFYQTTTAAGIEFLNNLISITRGGTSENFGLYLNTAASGIASDHNVIYIDSLSVGKNRIAHLAGTDYTYFLDWKSTASGGYDQHSDTSNPIYQNAVFGNFTPTSKEINGLALSLPSITKDFYGTLRNPGTPDPGAIEFEPLVMNDSCHNATTISTGLIFGNTSIATPDLAPACAVGNSSSPGVWYRYASQGGFLNFTLCGSDFDTRLRVFEGSCSALQCITGNEDSCGLQSEVGFCSDSTEYLILVYGNASNHGNIQLNVTEIPKTVAHITASAIHFCPGDSAILTANPAHAYQWNNRDSSTTQSIRVKTDGKYKVIVLDTNGCSDTSDLVTVSMYGVTQPLISTSTGLSGICPGDSLQLTASHGQIFTWNDSSQSHTKSIYTQVPGIYLVAILDSNGCESTSDSLEVQSYMNPEIHLGNDTIICDGTILTVQAGVGYASYQWSTGESSPQIQVGNTPGVHQIIVRVTDMNGCEGTDTIMVTVEICTGIQSNITETKPRIFPNPGNGNYQILLTESNSNTAVIQVYAITGEMVLSQELIMKNELGNLDLTSLNSGVYFVSIIHELQTYTSRVILHR